MKPGALYGAEEERVHRLRQPHVRSADGLAAGLFLLEMLAMQKISVNKILRGPWKKNSVRTGTAGTTRTIRWRETRRADGMAQGQTTPAKLLRSPLVKVDARDGVKLCSRRFTWLMLRRLGGRSRCLRIYCGREIG